MKHIRRFLAFLLVFVMTFALAACSGESKSEEGKKQETTKKIDGKLRAIVTSDAYGPLFEKFTKEVGPKVEFVSMATGEALERLEKGGKPVADLWFGGGIESFMAAKEQGFLEKVEFEAASELDPEYKDADNYWFSKGLTVVGFIVNNEELKVKGLDKPKSWADLTESQYEGEIIMSNPATSGTNYAVVNALLQVKGDGGWDYFEDLNENVMYYAKRGAVPSQKVASGEAAIGITYIDGTIEALEETGDLSIIYPREGMPFVPEGVAAFANAENTEAAKAFIEWLYSDDENMKLLAELDQKNTCVIIKPNIKGLKLDFDRNTLMKEDLSLFGKQRKEILSKWDTFMGDKGEV